MNIKLGLLGAGVLFFLGQGLDAQSRANDTIPQKSTELEEVVIVGYSRVVKENYVGSADKIDAKEIQSKNVSNVTQALAGESAGVRVINTTGQPGADATIRIRGFGSINGNRDPLFVIDGVPFLGRMSSINMQDVESYTVLKDATATSVYGSRGANGVILITTKSGRAGRSEIQIENKTGFNTAFLPRYQTIKSPERYAELSWEALRNRYALEGKSKEEAALLASQNLFSAKGISPKYNLWNQDGINLIDPNTGTFRNNVSRKYNPENWEDHAFQTSMRQETNVSLSAGAGKTKFYTGIGYLKDIGYSINSSFERYTGRLNASSEIKPWLKTDVGLNYAFSKSKQNGQSNDSGSIFWFVDNMPAIYPLYLRDENGAFVPDPIYGGNQFDYGEGRGFGALTNAISDAYFNTNESRRHEIGGNFLATIDITPNLSFETRVGGQYYNSNNNQFGSPYYGSSATSGGNIYKYNSELFNWTFLQLLRFTKRYGNHNVQAFAAHETNSWENQILYGSKSKVFSPNVPEFNNAVQQNPMSSFKNNYSIESYFGQLTYDFNGKYFLSGTVRRDGSSRFLLKDKKWGTFGSVGAGWIVTKEDFYTNKDFVSYIKVKGSYGVNGDQAGVGLYPGYAIYDPGNNMGELAAIFNRSGYPDLTWEKSKMTQAGVELAFFNSRAITLNVDYYNKLTDGLIFDRRVAPSTGNAIVKVNDGLLQNQGIDFDLNINAVRNQNFNLSLGINGEHYISKLKNMPIDPSTGKEKVLDLAEAGFGRAAGRGIYDYYMRGWAGVNPETGAAQWVQYYDDKNNNGALDTGEGISSLHEYQNSNPNAKIAQTTTENYAGATQYFIGKSAIPKLRGAFNINIGIKNITLTAQFLYSLGGYSYDYTYAGLMRNSQIGNNNWHVDIENRWQKPGDITDVPRISSNYGKDVDFASTSSRFITSSDYLALNNVQLMYDFGDQFRRELGMRNFSLFVSGDNLWLLTKRKGFNPTVSESGNTSTYTYSPLSNISFGVRANF